MTDKDKFDAAVQIFSSYVGNHSVERAQMQELASDVAAVVERLALGGRASVQEPAVPIDQSYTDDDIVCLEDGVKVKLLTRYLKSHHKMTPEEYREKWGLPEDYPFVAKSYSEKRSKIAKDIGLGKS